MFNWQPAILMSKDEAQTWLVFASSFDIMIVACQLNIIAGCQLSESLKDANRENRWGIRTLRKRLSLQRSTQLR